MFLVDSHCHLDGLDYQSLHKNVDDVLAKAAARDVKFCPGRGDHVAGLPQPCVSWWASAIMSSSPAACIR